MQNIPKNIITRQSNPSEFAQYASFGFWKPQAHLSKISEYLSLLESRKIKKLIINMPPRHGKSELISKYFPAWYLAKNPSHRVILTSYETRFAEHWGKMTSSILTDDELGFGINFEKGNKRAGYYKIDNDAGSLSCLGAGGALTGRGADLIIIDDPIKNSSEISSSLIRENLYDWFKSTVFTRLEPNGVIVILMTRWHPDDICGRIQSDFSHHENKIVEGNDWHVLKLPAIAEENDPLARNEGEALWRDRFSEDSLEEIRKTLGTFWFSSLYQQNPIPPENQIFFSHQFKFFDFANETYDTGEKKYLSKDCPIFFSVDLAVSTSERADYTVVAIFALSPDSDIFVIDIIRKRTSTDHTKIIKGLAFRYNPILVGVESVAFQSSILDELKNAGLSIKKLIPNESKTYRACPLVAKMQAGKVFFPRSASWFSDCESEMLNFPNGRHDDMVDALAYGAIMTINISSGFELKSQKNTNQGLDTHRFN